MREIGSEFSIGAFPDSLESMFPKWLQFGSDRILTFSGRTAIECALIDILEKREVREALLPSYCCASMIEPFEKAGINVQFYDVFLDAKCQRLCVDLVIQKETEIVLFCNYFGYETPYPKETLAKFKEKGGIVIEDITHSLLRENPYHLESDYYIASVRKWGALLSGGLCCKRTGKLVDMSLKEPEKSYQMNKKKAMLLKEQYLQSGDETVKSEYLNLFSQCNRELGEQYSKLIMDDISALLIQEWDIIDIRQKRKQNSMFLHERLKKLDCIKPLFELREEDYPLFIPIVCKDEQQRMKLRQRLTQENIYCPIHWPKPSETCKSNLYKTELSLICDQRYSTVDMQRICEVIEDEFNK